MTGRIALRLAELGIALPTPPPVAGAYVPCVAAGRLLFVSGQLPMVAGEVRYRGRVGEEVSLTDGIAAARLCAINLLAQVKAALGGDLDRVERVVRLGGFVACGMTFTDQPKVLNGASELMVEVFGAAGRHSRVAVGAPALPLGAAVEIDAIFALTGEITP
jgi:enamine deaminase RidA (YjgF/YER057c/UK114 family)